MSGIACYLLTVYLAGYYIAEPHIRKEFPDVGSRLVVAFRMSVWLYLPLFSGINHDCVNLLLLLLELLSRLEGLRSVWELISFCKLNQILK